MLILTVRTDKPEAELGLFEGDKKLKYEVWHAHRELAETIHNKLQTMLESEKKKLSNIDGIVVFKGPGSFTGLRIGITVANALANSLHAPIVAADSDEWIGLGTARLLNGESEKIALPEYGGEPNITQQKK